MKLRCLLILSENLFFLDHGIFCIFWLVVLNGLKLFGSGHIMIDELKSLTAALWLCESRWRLSLFFVLRYNLSANGLYIVLYFGGIYIIFFFLFSVGGHSLSLYGVWCVYCIRNLVVLVMVIFSFFYRILIEFGDTVSDQWTFPMTGTGD